MDLQTAAHKYSRLLTVTSVATVICLIVAGVMLIASLSVGHSHTTGEQAKSVSTKFTKASLTL